MARRAGAAEEGTLLSIQYLRAVAALMVVAYHAMRRTKVEFDVGAAGVDMFFVISGFILWTIAAERPLGPVAFLKKRWLRVAPLYWVLTLVVAALSIPWPKLFWDAEVTPAHLLLSLLFVQHLNGAGYPFPVITAGWSLNYEAVFYLMFAASLAAPQRHRLKILLALLAAMPLIGFYVSYKAYMLLTNMFFLQFGAGVLLAEARLRGWLPERRFGLAMVGMGAALFAGLALSGSGPDLWRPLTWGAPALLMVVGLVSAEADGGLPRVRWLGLLGDASYSIYLAHFLAIALLSDVFYAGWWWFAPASAAVGVAAGLLCWYGLERPLLAMARRRQLGFLPSRAI